jgi:hypothetical protein
MKHIIFFAGLFFLASCTGDNSGNAPLKDSLSSKDSLKKILMDNLPSPTDIKQFNWMYSGFMDAATGGGDIKFNVFIHPKYGLWIIHSEGATPRFTHVTKINEYLDPKGLEIIPMDRLSMMSAPKDETLPVVDCDSKDFYNKPGCYTQQQNLFAQEKIWKYAGLNADEDKQVAQLASTITRTVINTETYRFYFSLIDGAWYLTFIDIRKPCQA